MAEMRFNCPKCQQEIACDELWGGHELQCPTCHAEIMVPTPGAAAPAATAAAPTSPPNSLVPQVPTSAPKLSIGTARHQPAAAPPQASAQSTTARVAAGFVKKKQPSKIIYVLQFAGFLLVLAVVGYFGWNWYQNRQKAKEEAEKAAAAQAAAAAAAANPPQAKVIPVDYTLDVTAAKIPEGKVNGTISGSNFVAETIQLGLIGSTPALSIFQGAQASPEREVLVYLRPKPGEKWSGHTWTVSSDMKTGVPLVAKRWKVPTSPTPVLQNYASGYALKLEFGQIKDGAIPGKIYLALPDNDHTVVAGEFKATTTFNEGAPAAAATAPPPPMQRAPAVTPAAKVSPEQRYGVQ